MWGSGAVRSRAASSRTRAGALRSRNEPPSLGVDSKAWGLSREGDLGSQGGHFVTLFPRFQMEHSPAAE